MLGTLLLLWIGFSLCIFFLKTHRPKNFPPGPRPIPIFGNLLQLNLTNPINDLVERVANTVPLSAFHKTIKDTHLMGYDIPKDTLIIQNLSSVLSEESQWKFPHEFNPSNFLNEQGEFVKPEAFMPFSIGPRTCLGESLARTELFPFLVTLFKRFIFVWPEDAGKPDFTPVFGGTQSPKPFKLGVRLRENAAI